MLYSFQGGSDGRQPSAGVVMDSGGSLYGTTVGGGADDYGTVYELPAGGAEQVLHSFSGGQDGNEPQSGLVLDASGNLYGTTDEGGSLNCARGGCGTVFELDQDGAEKVLYAFSGRDGKSPQSTLLLGENGKLYGTTVDGGRHKDGVVFSIAN